MPSCVNSNRDARHVAEFASKCCGDGVSRCMCDPTMCRTTDSSDGFDCWADGVWEAFACADGYLAVLTGESWLNGDGTRVQEITCCRQGDGDVNACLR